MEGPYQKEVAAERKVLRHLLFQVQIFIPTEHLGELVKPRLDAFGWHFNWLHNYYVLFWVIQICYNRFDTKNKTAKTAPTQNHFAALKLLQFLLIIKCFTINVATSSVSI